MSVRESLPPPSVLSSMNELYERNTNSAGSGQGILPDGREEDRRK